MFFGAYFEVVEHDTLVLGGCVWYGEVSPEVGTFDQFVRCQEL